MIDCYRLDLAAADDSELMILDSAERERAARFRFAKHRSRFIAAHAQTRRLLGARLGVDPASVPLTRTGYGKPVLAATAAAMAGPAAREHAIWFNLTHSEAVGYLAMVTCSVGIDVELARPIADLQPLIESCCSASEVDALACLPAEERVFSFLSIWTRKEAALKAWGTGIGAIPLNELHVGFDGDSVPLLQRSPHPPSQYPPLQYPSFRYPALRIRSLVTPDQVLSIAAVTDRPLTIRMIPAHRRMR